MQRGDRVISITLLFLAICICIRSIQLRLGSWHDPGAGFFPLIMGILLGGLSVLHLIQIWEAESKRSRESFGAKHKYGKSITIVSVLFGYAITLETLGFLLCTFLSLIVLSISGMENRRWVLALGGSFAVSLSAYVLFSWCLKVRLPTGILGF